MIHLGGWVYQAAQATLDGDTKEYLKSHLFLTYTAGTSQTSWDAIH